MVRASAHPGASCRTRTAWVAARRLGRLLVALSLTGGLSGGVAAAHDEGATAEVSMCRKLHRGVAGIAFGVLEIPATIARETRESGPLSGLVFGLGEGVGRFVARELVGVYQVVTALFDAPDPYPDVLEPEFPWSSFRTAEAADPFADEAKELAWVRGIEIDRSADALVVRFPGDLLFDSGSDRVMPEAELRLLGLAETLERHPGTTIVVQGHTDSTGPPEFNRDLSERRARSVRDFLVEHGLPADRITTQGFGSERPIASNDSPEGRRANRRVEVELRN